MAATAALLGTRGGLIAAAVAVCVDNVIARSLKVIALDLLPWALLTSLGAYLVLVFSIGALRRLLLRVDKANRALAEANRLLAEEARLRTDMARGCCRRTLRSTRAYSTPWLKASAYSTSRIALFLQTPRAERLFLSTPGQLVGQSLRDLVDPDGVSVLTTARPGAVPGLYYL